MKPEYHEGPQAKENFDKGMTKLFQAKKPAPKEKPTAESKQGETSKGYCLCLPRFSVRWRLRFADQFHGR